jgi:glycosyltransferase involved in cell wall biosynthesis
MNVLALTPNRYGHSPGQRSSIELWERVLAPAGIRIDYAPFETERLQKVLYRRGHHATKAVEMLRAFGDRLRLLRRRLREYDAVFVYREAALLGPAVLEKWIARRGKPIIYQIDDPLYVPYRSPSNGYLAYLKCFSKVGEIARVSRVVIANSSQIHEYVSRFNGNVRRIPCLVDTERYVYRESDLRGGPVTVGWSGSPSTVGNVSLVAEALRELAGRVEHRVHLIGGTEFDLPGVRHTAQAWSAATEVEDLRRMQVGMVPLPANEWNKRKFLMKVPQYMALGIPPVATPLGSNPEVIEPGVTGFLADTPAEWVERLETLIRDHDLRRSMAREAARVAGEKYSLASNAGKIVEAFRAAVR